MIRVLLVDDHSLVRAGVTTLLQTDPELAVVGEARDGREALAAVADTVRSLTIRARKPLAT